ncbi:hypothetical protein COY06_06100 [Candidatus Peregrinibacteria bacterium CG_4_10_14_0_2_um_filter_41_8]|nr:MAG: hypothetical protein COY06_06100 [Candidatus Peregrinibacteria bacterium CG_4_10_14_0_2_um_filter_41_8]
MKLYKTKHAEVGQGVEATVLFHKDNGEELICVHSDYESFEKQNPKASECSKEDADKLIKKTKIKLAVPKRKELRKTKKLSDEDIMKEIEDTKTPTVNVIKSDNDEAQTLTFVEEVEVASIDEFFEAQKAQSKELDPEIIEEVPQETVI